MFTVIVRWYDVVQVWAEHSSLLDWLWPFIHSFNHSEHLYGACQRWQLSGAPSPILVEKNSIEVLVKSACMAREPLDNVQIQTELVPGKWPNHRRRIMLHFLGACKGTTGFPQSRGTKISRHEIGRIYVICLTLIETKGETRWEETPSLEWS